jgi:hypothetical protein
MNRTLNSLRSLLTADRVVDGCHALLRLLFVIHSVCLRSPFFIVQRTERPEVEDPIDPSPGPRSPTSSLQERHARSPRPVARKQDDHRRHLASAGTRSRSLEGQREMCPHHAPIVCAPPASIPPAAAAPAPPGGACRGDRRRERDGGRKRGGNGRRAERGRGGELDVRHRPGGRGGRRQTCGPELEPCRASLWILVPPTVRFEHSERGTWL